MRGFLRKKLAGLCGCSSGNATVIVALGMPMLIGGAGLGVDVAQWYMWKRELQFAVDQAAMAGAWARSSSNTAVQGTFEARALQEYNANLGVVKDFDSTPLVKLEPYGTGTNNSVLVTASATKALPFSSLLTDAATTVAVRAQAIWSGGVDFHACMLALNTSKKSAFKLGGSASGSSTCGAGTLSTSNDAAMFEASNTSIPLGTVVAAGDIDDSYANNVSPGNLYQNQEGLRNPYEDLDPPSTSGQISQTYPSPCPVATPASTTYTANGTTTTHYTYTYHQKSNDNNLNDTNDVPGYTSTGYVSPSSSSPVAFTGKSVATDDTDVLEAPSAAAAGTPVDIGGNGSSKMWRVPHTSTQDTITEVIPHYTPATDGKVYLSPGIYSSLVVECETVFSPGVYFISGTLNFGHNETITGTGGVMFVLTTDSGDIHINDDSDVTLSGISASTLINSYGYSPQEAAQLAGMLIWDPESTGDFTINGNASMHLSGVLYMPNRDAKFNGNGSQGDATGSCLMVAADTIDILGNFSLSNFCTTTGGSAMSIGGTNTSVRLVS